MTGLDVGDKVKVRYVDILTYTLEVEVTGICPSNEFIGRVERIFSGSEITGVMQDPNRTGALDQMLAQTTPPDVHNVLGCGPSPNANS